MKLTFDKGKHIYFIDGVQAPSVTKIMAPLVDYSIVPADILARAAAFGTASHSVCSMEIGGVLDYASLDEDLYPILLAFQNWRHDHPEISIRLQGGAWCDETESVVGDGFSVEQMLGHPKRKYCGTPDIVIDGEYVIDIKTRAPNKLVDSIQCSGYEELWIANGGTKAPKAYEHRILFLKRDGTYEFPKVNHRDARSRFLFLLDHYNNRQFIERWK